MLRRMLEEQQGFRIEQITHQHAVVGATATDAERDVESAILDAAQVALRDIQTALGRITAGTYGSCTQCGAALPLERLEVLPQVGLCMRCQRDHTA